MEIASGSSSQPPTSDKRPTDRLMRVSIAGRTIVAVASVFAGVLLLRLLPETLVIIVLGVLLASVVDRPSLVLQRLGLGRGVSVFAILAALVLALVLVVVVMVPMISSEYAQVQDHLTSIEDQADQTLRARGIHLSGLNSQRVASMLSANFERVASYVTQIGFGVGHVLLSAFGAVVIAYMLSTMPGLMRRQSARFLSPIRHQGFMRIADDVHQRVGGWARGQVIVAATFGALFGSAAWLIGLPFAISLGIIAGVLEVIPYLGGLVTVILAVMLAMTLGWWHVLAVLVAYVVLINIESHILAPKLIGNAVGLPPVAVLMALLAGLELRGVVGVLLAVLSALVIAAVLDEFWPTGVDLDSSAADSAGLPAPD